MSDTATLAQQMVAATPATTRNVNPAEREFDNGKLHSGAGVGMDCVARLILGQKDTRDGVPFLINHDNVT